MVTQLDPTTDIAVSTSPDANILDNGGFNIWQRGTSFTNPTVYTVDRWKADVNGSPSWTVTQEATIVDQGLYSLKIQVTAAGGASGIGLAQYIENWQQYKGKTLSVSVRVYSNVNFSLYLSDGTQTPSTTAHTGNNTWQTLTGSIVVSNNANSLRLETDGRTTNHTTYIGSVMLVIGNKPQNFVPLHPQTDLARCQRYYEVSGSPYGVTFRALGINNGGQYQLSSYQPFSVLKRVSPTITLTGTIIWEQGSQTNQVANYGFTAANSDAQGFELTISKSAGGNFPSLVQAAFSATADL
jgi:hypothetical protein